jgi:ribonuclease HI
MMAGSDRKSTKNPKISIQKLIDQESTKVTLLWASNHVGISGNETADDLAKEAFNEEIHHTERYPPQDLIQ